MNKIKERIFFVIVLIITLLAACSQPKMTVNEKLYPFFKVVNGQIFVVDGASMPTLTIPDDIISGGQAVTEFGGFENPADKNKVSTVVVSGGVTAIADGAFSGAGNLKDVDFSSASSLGSIGEGAFKDTDLSSVTIPSSVTSIGKDAFAGNDNLTDVDISSSGNTDIGDGAFSNTALRNITVSASKTGAESMKSIFGENYKNTVEKVTITGPGVVGNGFQGSSALTNVVVRDGVESIGENAFSGASSLASVSLPSSVTSIRSNAFNGTLNLTDIELPSSLETIGENAFAGCGYDEYTLPSSMKDVAADAFDSDDVVYITYDIYSNRNGEPAGSIVVELGESIIEALEEKKDTFAPFENATVDYVTSFDGSKNGISSEYSPNETGDGGSLSLSAQLPSASASDTEKSFISGKLVVAWADPNVKYNPTEDDSAFEVGGLKEDHTDPDIVYISGTHLGKPVTGVADNAFGGIDLDVVFSDPSKITDIGSGAFQNNTGIRDDILKDFTNDNLTIGENAFAGTGITESTIPDGLASIPDGMFNGASNLNSLKNPDGTQENVFENVGTIGENAFKDTALSNDDPLKGSSVTSVGKGAFQGTDIGPTVTIPSSVTDLEQNSFADNDSIKDVIIESGSGLTANAIAQAFGTADESENITKPSSATSLTIPADLVDSQEEIDALVEAFPNLKDLNIVGDGSNELNGSFSDFENLEKVVISGVTAIGKEDPAEGEKGVFEGLGNLTSVTLPEGLTSIGDNAFAGCDKLESIAAKGEDGEEKEGKLPSSVTTIGDNAFKDTSVTGDPLCENNNITSVGSGAFQNTDAGKTVTIPSNVTSFGESAFATEDGTRGNITSVVVEPNDKLTGDDIAKGFATITGGGTENSPFETANPASSVKELTIPADMIKEQADVDALHKAFPNLEKLVITGNEDGTSVIPSDVSFADFDTVKELVIGAGVTAIGGTSDEGGDANGPFADMGRLETVKLPEGLETIGDNAFNGSAVKDVITIDKDGQPVENGEGKLPSSVTTIGENAFKDTDLRNPAGIYDAETGEVSGGLFDLIDNNTSNDGLSIGDNAFAGTSVGPAVKLPENTTSVGAGAFDDVALGNTITIPSSVGSLGEGAFTGNDRNDSITSVVVEPNANGEITGQTIADAFADITGDAASGFETNNPASTVKELTIPVDMVDTQEEVDAIHAAFPNLEKITITGGANDSVTTIPSDVSFDAFDKVTGLVIGEGITEIGKTTEGDATPADGPFAGMDSLTSVTLPESLTNIGDNAFSGNESLKNVATSSADGSTVTNGRLPSTVETVGDNAFANTGISGDIFAGNDGSLTSIGDGAFSGITGSLGDEDGKLTIPETVTTIGKDAFKGTDSIKDVTIPSSVESLGSGAFADTGLTSVTIEDNSNFENTSPVNKLDELYAAFVSRDENGDITSVADKVTSLTIPEKLYDQDKIKDTFPNLEAIRITASESGHVEGGLNLGSLDKVTSVTADDGVMISELPEGITEIGITADQLGKNGLPESITGNISSVVVLPGTDSNNNEVTTIPGGAFDGATNLENVKIEEGITAVGSTGEDSEPLFGDTGASKPVTVELPSSVTTIGDKVFADDKITVTLPEEGADKITSVGNGAFEGNKNVTNDILDKLTGLESIGDNAFADTSISGEVTIPSSVDNLGSGAFAGNDGITSVVVEPNDKLTGDDIAKGFATITGGGTENSPFETANPASSVKELTIPADMIKEQADVDALHKAFPNLEKLVITGNEDGTSVIPSDVSFADFDTVKELVIGAGVTAIGGTSDEGGDANGPFADMGRLETVKLPEGLTNIGDNAFSGNESLKNVATSSADGSTVTNGRLPSTVETVGDNAFANTGISGDIFAGNDGSLTSIGDGAFSGITGCLGDKDGILALPEGLESIGNNAFEGTKVNGVAVTEKGEMVEDGMHKLPSTVTNIGDNAFKDTSLKSPAGEKDSETDIVSGGLFDRIENSDKNTGLTIGEGAFAGTNVGPAISLPDKTVSVGDGAFAGISNANGTKPGTIDVKVPAQLTGDPDGDGVKEGLAGIFTDEGNKNVAIGNLTVTASEEENGKAVDLINPADESASDITVDKVILEEGLTSIEDGAFADTDVKEVATLDKENGNVTGGKLPSSVTSVGEEAFQNTEVGPVVTIPATVESFGENAFADNEGITTVIVEQNSNGTLSGDDIAKGFATITGAGTSSDPYKTDNPASNVTRLEIPADMIKDQADVDALVAAFPDVTELVITGNEDCTSVIPDVSFAGFEHVSEVTITEGVTAVGTEDGVKGPFAGMNALTSVTLPDSLETIGNNAFKDTGLTGEIILPEGLTNIGDSAFSGAEGINKVSTKEENGPVTPDVIPSTVTNIGDSAFAGTSLKSPAGNYDEATGEFTDGGLFDKIANNEKNTGLSIGESAFANTNVGPDVYIPSNTVSVGDGAFSGINGTDSSDISGLNVKAPAKLTADPNGDEDNGLVEIFINPDSEAGADDTPVVIDNLIVSGDDTEQGVSDTLGELTNNNADDGYVDLILGNVVLEEGVTAVGDNAFSGVGVEDGNSLTVTLPESEDKPFTAIGENAFNGGPLAVDSEGKVVESDPVADLVVGKEDEDGTFVEKLPSTVTEIGSGAFLDSGLGKNDENGGLGGTITGEGTPDADITGGFLGDIEGELSIGENAFGNTNIGPTINIPEGTTSVGDGAFAGITPENEGGNGGINVKVPSAITGDHDKNGDGSKEEGSLSDIFIDKNNETTKPVVIDNLIVTGNKDSEDDVVGAIAGSPADDKVDVILGNVVIDENVDAVGDNAFTGVGVTGDDYILSVDLPEEGLTSIGNSAFENAPLPVENDGTIIENGSVDGVLDITTGGESGRLPATVTEIGDDAFKDSGLGNGDENIGGTYDPDKGIVTGGILADLKDTAIGSGAFENTNIGPVVNIPESVTSIGEGAFAGITPNKTTYPESGGLVVQIPDDLVNGNETGKGIDDYFTTTGSEVPVEFDEIIITGGNIDKLVTDEGKISVDSIVINPGKDEEIVISDDAFNGLSVPENEDGKKVLTVTLPDDFTGSITTPSFDSDELGFEVVFKQGDQIFEKAYSYTVVYRVGDADVFKEEPVSYFAGLGTYKLPTENDYMSGMTYTADGVSVADGDLIALDEEHEVVATGTSKKISITVDGEVVDAYFGNPISDYTHGSYITSADNLTGKVTDKVSSEEGFTGPKYVIPGLDKIYTVHNVTVARGDYAAAVSVANLSGWYIEGSDISSSIKGVTSSVKELEFNSWVAKTGVTEGGKITGDVTLTPNWKYDIKVNNGTSSSTVTAYIGPKDSSGNYTRADLKAAVDKLSKPSGSQFGLVTKGSSSVQKTLSVPSDNAALTPSDVIDKELNVYYQFNVTLNTGVSAVVSGTSTAVVKGNYVEHGTTVTINSSNGPAGWTPVSDNVVKDGKKVSNTITVNNSSSVSGNYDPLYQKKVTVQGVTGEKTVEYSPNTSYQGSKFSDIIPASSDGAVYAVGKSDKLASSSSIINRDDKITPDNLTDNTISKYYNVSVYPDNGKGGYYKDGSTSISGITSGFSYYYVSASPVSGRVSGPSNNASVSSGTKYIYQIHKIDFVTDTAKGTLNGGNTEYYTRGSTVSKTVTPKDGFAFASWNPGLAAVTGDATYTARYSWNITVSIYKNGELQTTTNHKVTDGGTYPATGYEVTGSNYVFSSDSTYKPGTAVTGSEKNFVYSYFTVGASTDSSDPAQQGYVYERDGHYYQLYLIGPYHRLGTSKTEVTGLLNDARTELDKRGLNGNAWNLADEALIRYLHNNDSYRTSIQNWMDSVKGSGGPYIENAYENIWIKESVDSQYYDTTKQPGYTLVKYAFFDALKGADNLIPCTSSSYYVNGPGNKNMDDTEHAYKLVLMVRQIN